LVLFDREQVVSSAAKEHGLSRLGLSMGRIGQGEFGVQIQGQRGKNSPACSEKSCNPSNFNRLSARTAAPYLDKSKMRPAKRPGIQAD
jgi:hypothetical protein